MMILHRLRGLILTDAIKTIFTREKHIPGECNAVAPGHVLAVFVDVSLGNSEVDQVDERAVQTAQVV